MLMQKCLYFNCFLSLTWFFVSLLLFTAKLERLDHLTYYLSTAVFALLTVIECTRLYLGYYGNSVKRVPELAGFLILTLLMQLPLVSYFLFNTHLMSTPTEITLHAMMWTFSVIEVFTGFYSLKDASQIAKSVYLSSYNRSR